MGTIIGHTSVRLRRPIGALLLLGVLVAGCGGNPSHTLSRGERRAVAAKARACIRTQPGGRSLVISTVHGLDPVLFEVSSRVANAVGDFTPASVTIEVASSRRVYRQHDERQFASAASSHEIRTSDTTRVVQMFGSPDDTSDPAGARQLLQAVRTCTHTG